MHASTESEVLGFFISEFGDNDAVGEVPDVVSSLMALGFSSSDLGTLFSTPRTGNIGAVLNVWRHLRQVSSNHKPSTTIEFMVDVAIRASVLKWLESPALHEEFTRPLSAEGAGFRKTRFLYHSFLTKSLFEIGRKLSETQRKRSNRYLEATILQAEDTIITALPYELANQERFLRGQMGFSHLLLAFSTSSSNREEHLDKAVSNLRKAGQLGDSSLERIRYFCTAISELADFRDDPGLLDEAVEVLEGALKGKHQDAETLVIAARVLVQSSSAKYSIEGEGDADGLRQAIGYLDAALRTNTSFKPANLHGRRGQASLYLSWESGSVDTLNSAIDDLRTAYAAGETQWAPVLIDGLLNAQATNGNTDSTYAREAWDVARNDEGWTTIGGNEIDVRPIRIRSAYVYGRVAGDIEALQEVVQLAGSVDPEKGAKATGLLGLLLGDREMLENAINDLQKMPPNSKGPGLLPKLAQYLAKLVAEDDPSKALDLLNIADEALGRDQFADDPLTMWLTAKHRFQAWKIGGDVDDLEDALALSQQVRASDSATTPENLVLAADIELQAAKATDDPVRRKELLEAAIADLREGAPTAVGIDPVINKSKMGEILLRLGAITREAETLREAQVALTESYDSGNKAATLCSLVGDTYYHYSKVCEASEHISTLKLALQWKARARSSSEADDGAVASRKVLAREHFSLCARIHTQLQNAFDQDELHLDRALEYLSQARVLDPNWPWAVCQLAEVCHDANVSLYRDPDPVVESAVHARNETMLWRHAAELTLASEEFQRSLLGGKSEVWVAEDSLGLVSSTFVFKPAPEAAYRRLGGPGAIKLLEDEIERANKLARQLAAVSDVPVSFPEMIGVLETSDGRPVLAMRRLAGHTLAEALRRDPDVNMKHLHTAARILGIYHATTPITERNDERRQQYNRLKGIVDRCTEPSLQQAKDVLAHLLEEVTVLPLVGRRDAHPGNWFITPKDKLAVIDLEYPTCKLLIEELVQLVDDVPAMGWGKEGQQKRREILKEYYDWFVRYGGISQNLTPESMLRSYSIFGAVLGMFGVSFSSTKLRDRSMTPIEKGDWERRHAHYIRLVEEMVENLA